MHLDQHYFLDKPMKEMSAAGIMYLQLVKPEMMFEIQMRGRAEGFGFEDFVPENVPQSDWFPALRKRMYANDIVLRSAILKHEEDFIPAVLNGFISSGNDTYIDHAMFILALSNQDIEAALLEALPKFKYPYTQSVACLVLGAKGSQDSQAVFKVLDYYYHYYKTTYPAEQFEQGPLFGLRLLLDRQTHHHHHHHDGDCDCEHHD